MTSELKVYNLYIFLIKPREVIMSNKSTITNDEFLDEVAKSIWGARVQNKQSVANGSDRQEMVSTVAYYRAESRGFDNGDEIQGWLGAEAEIDT
jgi:hypothetical protein